MNTCSSLVLTVKTQPTNTPPAFLSRLETKPFKILGYETVENCLPAGGKIELAIVTTVEDVNGPATCKKLLAFKRNFDLAGLRNEQGIGPNYAKLLETVCNRNWSYPSRGFMITHVAHGVLFGRKFGHGKVGRTKLKQGFSPIPAEILVDHTLIFRVPDPV